MQPLLRVVNLSKSFGPLPVIKGVSFDIMPGEVVGLTGSIGSGKSVLVSLLAGKYEPDLGEIYYKNSTTEMAICCKSSGDRGHPSGAHSG